MKNANELSARRVAVEILNRCRPEKQFVAAFLETQRTRTPERQRCTDLVLGVLRRRGSLDLVITLLGQRALRSIEKTVLNVLRVAVYELTACPAVPTHAIVHEAVETAKRVGSRRSGGFVNAVLRQITRHIADREVSRESADRRRLMVNAESACLFTVDLWSDPATHLPEYLHQVFNLPIWLVQSWISAYGKTVAQEICRASNRRPSLYLRPNPLRCSADQLCTALAEAEHTARLTETGLIQLRGSGALTNLPGYGEGWFSVQDSTAALAVSFLAPLPQEKILDLCAAPGGKTTQMAEYARDQAIVIATDRQTARLQRVTENVQRLGLASVQVVTYDQFERDWAKPAAFDALLLDVPCSNTGVLAKRVEVRYRLQAQGIETLLQQQRQILARAAAWVRPGGRFCYSTCSIQPEENQGQVQWFLKKTPGFRCQVEKVTLPKTGPTDQDGGYAAVLLRE